MYKGSYQITILNQADNRFTEGQQFLLRSHIRQLEPSTVYYDWCSFSNLMLKHTRLKMSQLSFSLLMVFYQAVILPQ